MVIMMLVLMKRMKLIMLRRTTTVVKESLYICGRSLRGNTLRAIYCDGRKENTSRKGRVLSQGKHIREEGEGDEGSRNEGERSVDREGRRIDARRDEGKEKGV